MNKKKIIVPLLLLLAVSVYFIVFRKDKKLRYIPQNADAVVLIDTKKLTGQYLFSWLTHPSGWSGSKAKVKAPARPKTQESEFLIFYRFSILKIPDSLNGIPF
ncbi:hypothetical protein OWR28_22640 [Chryseobacterium sp. 1B4]